MKKSLKETIMERDGLEDWEAQDQINRAKEELYELLDEGGSTFDAEELIMDHFGLEPDFLEDLLDF